MLIALPSPLRFRHHARRHHSQPLRRDTSRLEGPGGASTIAVTEAENADHSGGCPCDRRVGLRLGTALAKMSRKIGLTNADVEALDQARDTKRAELLRFE